MGLQYNGDGFFGEAATFLDNVTASGEALRQDIYRLGGRISGNYQHTRRLSFGALYRYAYYSDVNNLNEANFNTTYLFLYAPQQLRLILSVNNLFYSNQTVFGPLSEGDIIRLVFDQCTKLPLRRRKIVIGNVQFCQQYPIRCIVSCVAVTSIAIASR